MKKYRGVLILFAIISLLACSVFVKADVGNTVYCYHLDGTSCSQTVYTGYSQCNQLGAYGTYVFSNLSDCQSQISPSAPTSNSLTINFTYPTESSGSVYTRNNILVNVTATETNLKYLTVYLYNSSRDLLISSTTPSCHSGDNCIPGNYNNFSYLKNGTYYFNATACNNDGICVSTETRQVSIGSLVNEHNNINEKTNVSGVPSTSNANIKFLIYGITVFLFILIISLWVFYAFKRRDVDNNKPSKSKIDEVITEKETKEKIPTSITESITVTGLGVKKGKTLILENVNFSVKRGEFVSLLGPSGSGKSTIIEILAGRRKASHGKIKIFEKDSEDEKINEHIGFVPQGNEIYLNQTVQQNLENSAIKWGLKNSKDKISKVLEQTNLSERDNLIANKLSGGQQKLLSLAMELIRDPELLILDEPTTGLDPNTRNQIITILSNLSRHDKKTILITTHFMDDAEECDDIIIIDNKKIAARGSPEKLKKMLPGAGRMVSLVLDNSNKEILDKIRKIKGVERIVAEGRNLNILTNNPNAIDIASKIHEYGVEVNESKISKATMKEVFVFFTGKVPEE